MNIKIIRRPIGEAPEWVRDAWIGLSLPSLLNEERRYVGFGVLSVPTNWATQMWLIVRRKSLQIDGYVVNAKAAVDILGKSQPEAAAWWRQNTPRILDNNVNFVFDTAACEIE